MRSRPVLPGGPLRRAGFALSALLVCLGLGLGSGSAQAAPDPSATRTALVRGEYEKVVAEARVALATDASFEWRELLLRGLLALGQRQAAAEEATHLVDRYPGSPEAQMLAHDVFLAAGRPVDAMSAVARIRDLVTEPGTIMVSANALVAAGRAALLAGDEPKAVLAAYFEEAVRRDPGYEPAYLHAGRLALDKHDDALAAEWFRRGINKNGGSADLHAGLARAFYRGDRKEMTAALDAALHINPRHTEALLLRAEHEIDGENYVGAGTTLGKALDNDGDHPLAWSFRAVLAHLRHDQAAEKAALERALRVWKENPEVHALVGRKLSEKYRFAEGAAYQKRALALDPAYLPAKARLAQDLLRLGKEREGWALAKEVHDKDGYDVLAFNLVTLKDHLDTFATRQRGRFTVRMAQKEAVVYGQEVLDLLTEASQAVDRQYGWKSSARVGVEIFDEQADFAVRTFGMPGGSGYLGVCFGPLITMNSPNGTGAPTMNWRAVLWHEYTHVVTLGLTKNRLPRWLAEGISVHEERRRDPTWGQSMTPRYREMILGDELVPIGKLSETFLNPRTPEHLVYAYYLSSLVVEFLIDKYGQAALTAVLRDLGAGKTIDQALPSHTAPMATLEKDFAAFATERARTVAPKADFSRPDLGALQGDVGEVAAAWRKKHPNSLWALVEESRSLVERGDFHRAWPLLERAVALHPDNRDPDGPLALLARVHRERKDITAERKTLEKLAALAPDAPAAYARLLEIAEASGDAASLRKNAERLLAVNPMLASGWRALGRGHEAAAAKDRTHANAPDRLGQAADAAAQAAVAYERLLLLDAGAAVDTRYRLAQLLAARDPRAAKRHLLDALAEAPRFRAGHKLLLDLRRRRTSPP